MSLYMIFPANVLSTLTREGLGGLNIDPRQSVDGSKVIMSVKAYITILPDMEGFVVEDGEITECPYPVYEHNSKELKDILSSTEWNSKY